MAKLTKSQFIDIMSENYNISKVEANDSMNHVFETLRQVLSDGNSISVESFGKFEVRARKARQGRNPQTGEAIQIPACNAPAFTASSKLKADVN